MSFRTKLFLVFLVSVLASVFLVTYGVVRYTRSSFQDMEARYSDSIVAQFKNEFAQRGEETVQQVKNIAGSVITLKVAIDLARPNADQSLYVHDANGAAQDHNLDFVELVDWDGTTISSVQLPSRVGYKNDWVTQVKDWNDSPAFLKKEDLPDGAVLALTAVRTVSGGNDKNLYVIGGRRLDQNFLSSLALPPGMRALLYRNLTPSFLPASLTDASGSIDQPERFEPLVAEIQGHPEPLLRTIQWNTDAASAESFHAIPLLGRSSELLGVLLVGSSRRELVLLTNRILLTAVGVAAAASLVGLLFAFWVSTRITRPIQLLAEGARDVSAGQWDARIDVRSTDEVGRAAIAFNDMTRTLSIQRDKLIQAERVAAWRELARRLAHELRNPLFPLQITVENLQRARQLENKQFLEVFNESTATLKAELANLNAIVTRFNDFSRMPAPRFTRVGINESLRGAVRLFEPQFSVVGKPTIEAEYSLAEPLPEIDADPDLLHRAFQNLVLNALDAMPSGGTLTLRTLALENAVRIEVSDTGTGLSREECDRLFTPYYTTKPKGTGLGLAIVQSIVSDHRGAISVSSEEGRGTTFRMELPLRQPTSSIPAPEETPARVSPPTLAAASD